MKDTITTACIVLWPEPAGDPHPARRLDPWTAAQKIMDCWNRRRMEVAPQLARLTLLRLAIQVPYPEDRQRGAAMAWACQEAPHWWMAFDGKPASERDLVQLFQVYLDTGKV